MTTSAQRAGVLVLATMLTGIGCAKKKAAASGTTTTTTTTAGGGATSGGGVTSTTTDPTQVSLPSTLSLVDSTNANASLLDGGELELAGATPYLAAKARVHVRLGLASAEAAKTVRGILCFIAGTDYTAHVGDGPYIAMVDQDRCFEANTDNSDQAAAAKNLAPAVIQAASAADGVTLSFWVRPNGAKKLLYAKGVITSGPSSTNPFGLFSMSFTNDDASNAGTLTVGAGSDSASVLVQYYETTALALGPLGSPLSAVSALAANVYPVAGQLTSGTYKARLMTNYGAAGAGKGTNGLKNSDVTFGVAFGNNRILESGTDGTANCLKADAVVVRMRRYALFNAADDTAVTLNSGFPLIDAAGGSGYIGYGGPSPNLTIKSGDTVYKADPKAAGGKGAAYTAVVSAGRLWKQTRVALTLAQLQGLNLDTWKNGQYQRVVYDGSSFAVSGTYAAGPTGFTFTPSASPAAFTLSAGSNAFSTPIGGVMVNTSAAGATGAVVVGISTVKREDATAAAGALSLYCLNRCPAGLLTNAMLSGTGTPYADPQPGLANLVPYAWAPASMTLSLTASAAAVALDPAVTSLAGQFAAGIESGPLYLAADYQAATRISDLLATSTFYTYTIGTQAFTKDTLLRDGSGAFVNFDPPLSFPYVHTTASDVNGDATYNGKQLQLNYGDYGNLWGIPYTQSPTTGQFDPNLSIASGTLVGPSSRYKVLGLGGTTTPAAAPASDCAALDPTKAPSLPGAPAAPLKFVPRPVGSLQVLVNDGAETLSGG